MAVDLPPLSQLALYDGNAGALTFDDKDTDSGVPRPSQLAEEEARLAHTYNDASDIDADVNALQANINALIENMGLDAAAAAHPSGGEQMPTAPVADFDFDAFLTAFASDHQDGAAVSLPLPEEQQQQPAGTVAGRKRTSDVAELGLPLPQALTPPAVELDATSAGPPRAKRNKK